MAPQFPKGSGDHDKKEGTEALKGEASGAIDLCHPRWFRGNPIIINISFGFHRPVPVLQAVGRA
jgi:hypothetical protein